MIVLTKQGRRYTLTPGRRRLERTARRDPTPVVFRLRAESGNFIAALDRVQRTICSVFQVPPEMLTDTPGARYHLMF